MSGHERAIFYQFAIETGMRANELRNLKVSSFNLSECTVTVLAAYSKHRKEDILPLRPEMAQMLGEYFTGRTPEAKVFGGRYKRLTDKTSKMIAADLADAGISYTDEAGRFRDFHSLRHTTGTWLGANGVHPKVAQAIMRHADINSTMSKYTHVLRGQEREAVAKLPDSNIVDVKTLQATGTNGADVTHETDLACFSADSGAGTRSCMQADAKTDPTGAIKKGDSNTPERIRTPNLRFRRPTLYPIELQAQVLSKEKLRTTKERLTFKGVSIDRVIVLDAAGFGKAKIEKEADSGGKFPAI